MRQCIIHLKERKIFHETHTTKTLKFINQINKTLNNQL